MTYDWSCFSAVALGIALARPTLTTQVRSTTEQSIYTTVLNWVAHQDHYKVLLVRDSTLPGFVLRFAGSGPRGSDTTFLDQDQEAFPVPIDTEAVIVPVVLLGDSVEHSRDWDRIYQGRALDLRDRRGPRPTMNPDFLCRGVLLWNPR